MDSTSTLPTTTEPDPTAMAPTAPVGELGLIGTITAFLATGASHVDVLWASVDAGLPLQEVGRFCVAEILARPGERAWRLLAACEFLADVMKWDVRGGQPDPTVAAAVGQILEGADIPRQSLVEVMNFNTAGQHDDLERAAMANAAALGLPWLDSIPGWGPVLGEHVIAWGPGHDREKPPVLPEGFICGQIEVLPHAEGEALALPAHAVILSMKVHPGASVEFGEGTVVGWLEAEGATLCGLDKLLCAHEIKLTKCLADGPLRLDSAMKHGQEWDGQASIELKDTVLKAGILRTHMGAISITGGSVPALGHDVKVDYGLEIRKCEGLRCIDLSLQGPEGEFMIEGCPALVDIHIEGDMSRVEKVTIKDCPSLASLAMVPVGGEVSISNCPALRIGRPRA